MKGHLSSLILLLAFFCRAQVEFQDGYIIDKSGKLIPGQIAFQSESKRFISCQFKKGDEAPRTLLPEKDIMEYGFVDYKVFSAKIVEGSFVEVLVLGELSLFKLNKSYYLIKDDSTYVLESNTEYQEAEGKKFKKEDTKWKGILSYLTFDCRKKIDQKKFKFTDRDMISVVRFYNDCLGTESKVFGTKKPWKTNQVVSDFKVGLTVSANSSTLITSTSPYANFKANLKSVDPSFGVLLKVFSPRFNKRTSLKTEIQYSGAKYFSLGQLSNGSEISYYEVSHKRSFLSFPLLIEYILTNKTTSPFVAAGYMFETLLCSKSKVVEDVVSEDLVTTSSYEGLNFDTNPGGFCFEAGVKRAFRNYVYMISARYSRLTDSTNLLTEWMQRIAVFLFI